MNGTLILFVSKSTVQISKAKSCSIRQSRGKESAIVMFPDLREIIIPSLYCNNNVMKWPIYLLLSSSLETEESRTCMSSLQISPTLLPVAQQKNACSWALRLPHCSAFSYSEIKVGFFSFLKLSS